MQLIIKQYLTLLKESGELDRLLPDLLLSMGIEPISRAQIGPRQYGVDVAAVGKDEDGKTKYFIFTIKQGDIGRVDWDGTPQSIRPSLEEIKDVYISSHIEKKYQNIPKKIIVCTGGEKKQEVAANWSGYVNKSQVDGILEYGFWGGDKLSLLLEEYLFNESIIPSELQSRLRKVLALIADSDYDLSDYDSILKAMFLDTDHGNLKKESGQKKARKAFRTISLCQSIIYFWAKNEGNLKPAINCSERTVLYAWDYIRRNELFDNRRIVSIFNDLYRMLIQIYSDYFIKVQQHCYVRNGFVGYGRHSIQENLNIFEHLGFLSLTGLLCVSQGAANKDAGLNENSQVVSEAVIAFLKNHMATESPCYDGHVIEISATILFLSCLGEKDFIENWIEEMIKTVAFSYRNMGRNFPIQSDSFDDLVALNVAGTKTKEELFELSTLLPTLAYWCISLGFESTYQVIRKVVADVFPECTLQIWYPDSDTEGLLYINKASRTGAVDAPMELVEDIEEMKERIKKVQKNTVSIKDISSIKYGCWILPIIASRQYRTPFLPLYWQQSFIKKG